jgi:hypothetical protein
MVTSLWAEYLRDCGSVPGMDKRFATFSKGPEWLWGTPSLLSLDIMVCYLYTFLGLCIAGYESICHVQYFSFTLREKNELNKMSLRFTLDIP